MSRSRTQGEECLRQISEQLARVAMQHQPQLYERNPDGTRGTRIRKHPLLDLLAAPPPPTVSMLEFLRRAGFWIGKREEHS